MIGRQIRLFHILIGLAVLGAVGCSTIAIESGTALVEASGQSDSPDTNHVTSELHGISFDLPDGWLSVEGEELINVAPSEAEIPLGYEYFSSDSQTHYYIHSRSPYLTRADRIRNQRSTASEIAMDIGHTFEVASSGTLAGPPQALESVIYENATILVEWDDSHFYAVVINVHPDRVAVIAVSSNVKSKLETQKEIVNGIAATVQPVDQ